MKTIFAEDKMYIMWLLLIIATIFINFDHKKDIKILDAAQYSSDISKFKIEPFNLIEKFFYAKPTELILPDNNRKIIYDDMEKFLKEKKGVFFDIATMEIFFHQDKPGAMGDASYTLLMHVNKKLITAYHAFVVCVILLTLFYRKRTAMYIFLASSFIFVYASTKHIQEIDKWQSTPDTGSYFSANFSTPWASWRTPGVAYFWRAIGVNDDFLRIIAGKSAEEINGAGRRIPAINSLCTRIVLFQILGYGVAFTFLAVALCAFAPPAVSTAIVYVVLRYQIYPAPVHLMADPLCTIFTVFFAGLGLLYLKYKKTHLLYILSLVSCASFLIKPNMAFLPFICLMLIFCNVIYTLKRHEYKASSRYVCIGALHLLLTFIWPINLYIHGGFFVPGQLSGISQVMFAISFIQTEDKKLFVNTEYESFVDAIIAQKPKADEEVDRIVYNGKRSQYSKANQFLNSINQYGWVLFSEVYDNSKINDKYSNEKIYPFLKKTRVAMEIARPIIKAHYLEYVKTMARSFLSGFGFFPDLQLTRMQQHLSYKKALMITICFVIIIVSALLVGNTTLRQPIFFMASIHPLSILAHAMGHAVLIRYAQMTEWCFFVAALISMYSISLQLSEKIARWKHE